MPAGIFLPTIAIGASLGRAMGLLTYVSRGILNHRYTEILHSGKAYIALIQEPISSRLVLLTLLYAVCPQLSMQSLVRLPHLAE